MHFLRLYENDTRMKHQNIFLPSCCKTLCIYLQSVKHNRIYFEARVYRHRDFYVCICMYVFIYTYCTCLHALSQSRVHAFMYLLLYSHQFTQVHTRIIVVHHYSTAAALVSTNQAIICIMNSLNTAYLPSVIHRLLYAGRKVIIKESIVCLCVYAMNKKSAFVI